MEILLPLLIFVGGVIYSIVASSGNKDQEKRNIDPEKMERPGRSAPRRRPSNAETAERPEERSGGLFDELKREFKSEYEKATGQASDGETKQQSTRVDQENVKRRVEEERQKFEEKRQREKQKSSMRERSRGQSYRDRQPVERKQSERASRARESVYNGKREVKSDAEVVGAAEGIGREITEKARYSFGDDRTEIHERGREKDKAFSSKDLTFDKTAVVNGIIFNEILGKPKSRR